MNIIMNIYNLNFRFKFPAAAALPQDYRKHTKKYKQVQQKRDEFHDVLDPYIRQLIAEVNNLLLLLYILYLYFSFCFYLSL